MNIYLLGDAPNLASFNKQIDKIGKDDLVICLNKSIYRFKHLKDKLNLIHFFADHRFIEGNELDFTIKTIYPKKFKKVYNLEYISEVTYNPVWRVDLVFKKSLRAGRSVLIPALHYSYLQKPKEIIIYGVSLKDRQHWYSSNCAKGAFPAWMHILKDFFDVLTAFKDQGTQVLSGNTDSLLVDNRLILKIEDKDAAPEHTYFIREWAEFAKEYQANLTARRNQELCVLGH